MWDWLDQLLGLAGDAGDVATDSGADALLTGLANGARDAGDTTEWFFDTATNQMVSADEMQSIMDLDLSGSGSGPVGVGPQDYDWGAAAAGETGPGFATPEQIDATTPFNASSPGSIPWQGLAKGLADALKGLGGGSAGGAAGGLGSLGIPPLDLGSGGGSMTSAPSSAAPASAPAAGRVGVPALLEAERSSRLDGMSAASALPGLGVSRPDAPVLSGLPGLAAAPGLPATASPINAALARLFADHGLAVPLQSPVDAGPTPMKFTPLPSRGAPRPIQAAAPAPPPLNGLQRLALERRG